jgi:hypothetical protein
MVEMSAENRDAVWAGYNQDLMEYAREGRWGLYRNTRLSMGQMLKKEKRYLTALSTLLEVCYLDMNGPSNNGYFLPKEGMLYPGIIEIINILIKKSKTSPEEVEKMFFHAVAIQKSALKLTLKDEEVWAVLSPLLYIL